MWLVVFSNTQELLYSWPRRAGQEAVQQFAPLLLAAECLAGRGDGVTSLETATGAVVQVAMGGGGLAVARGGNGWPLCALQAVAGPVLQSVTQPTARQALDCLLRAGEAGEVGARVALTSREDRANITAAIAAFIRGLRGPVINTFRPGFLVFDCERQELVCEAGAGVGAAAPVVQTLLQAHFAPPELDQDGALHASRGSPPAVYTTRLHLPGPALLRHGWHASYCDTVIGLVQVTFGFITSQSEKEL